MYFVWPRSAPIRKAPVKSAPSRSASRRSAPFRPAPSRPAPLRSAPRRLAPTRTAPLRVAPLRSARLRSAPLRSALHGSVVRDEERFDKFVSLVKGFLRLGSAATLQVNMIDRDTLLRARENPGAPRYRTLIVRVWGFSALFVELSPALQEHVLSRTQHHGLGP